MGGGGGALERLGEEEGLHRVLGCPVHHVREGGDAARHHESLERAQDVRAGAEPLAASGGAVRVEERLGVLRPKGVPRLPLLHLEVDQVEALWGDMGRSHEEVRRLDALV